jgi:hypothetical protein
MIDRLVASYREVRKAVEMVNYKEVRTFPDYLFTESEKIMHDRYMHDRESLDQNEIDHIEALISKAIYDDRIIAFEFVQWLTTKQVDDMSSEDFDIFLFERMMRDK